MKTYTLATKPAGLRPYRKKTTVDLVFIDEPFTVETQEGAMQITPHLCDDWDNGYYLAYPSDGSKPYAIAPKYVRENYVPA